MEQHAYAQAHNILLPLAQAGDAEAQFTLTLLVNPNLGLLPTHSIFDAAKLLNVTWLRRSAHQGFDDALISLEHEYRIGSTIVPQDVELARCFHNAQRDKTVVATCRQLEETKGYIRTPEPLVICLACEPDTISTHPEKTHSLK